MARSSGGGSRGGGSHGGGGSSSSRSGGGHGSGFRTSKEPFRGSRKFRYYRNGTAHYIYSDVNLAKQKDMKPRWILILFYIPFIIAIFAMASGIIKPVQEPLQAYDFTEVGVIDNGDLLTDTEEQQILTKLQEFGDKTGIATKFVTIPYNSWSAGGSFETYALFQYSDYFNHEDGWMIMYTATPKNAEAKNWKWEGIQGDNTVETMDVFIENFNEKFHSKMITHDGENMVDVCNAAFDVAITKFDTQTTQFDFGMLFTTLGVAAFIFFHASVMIFAGTRKGYKYSELEEVTGYNAPMEAENNAPMRTETVLNGGNNKTPSRPQQKAFECRYCGYQGSNLKDNRCPNCGAMDL